MLKGRDACSPWQAAVITFAVTVLNGLHQPGDARAARRVPRSGGGAKDTSAQRTRRRNRRLNTSPPARAGPLAGRTRLPAYFILTFFYATFFYPIMVHWSWGQARLSESPPSPMRPWGLSFVRRQGWMSAFSPYPDENGNWRPASPAPLRAPARPAAPAPHAVAGLPS